MFSRAKKILRMIQHSKPATAEYCSNPKYGKRDGLEKEGKCKFWKYI